MSNDPSLDLQKAVFLTVTAAAPPIAGGRLYDRVPKGAAFPYVSFGPAQSISDDAQCVTGYELFMQLDVWSRVPGQYEMKGIVGDLKMLLHGADMPMDEPHALVSFEHEATRYLVDPDGLTSHGSMTFRALVERA